MNLQQAHLALRQARDAALTAYSSRLLADGMWVDDPAFAAKLNQYELELEVWRISAMTRICRVVEAALIEPR
jgi:hypothetical protein